MVELNGRAAAASDSHTVVDVDQIATSPSDPGRVPALTQKIEHLSKAFTSGQTDARLKLLEATESLLVSLETPRETILRYCWRNPTGFATIETAIGLGIVPLLDEGNQPKSVVELASATGAQVQLLQRIMKHLAAIGDVTEAGRDETGTTTPAITSIPAFLKQTNYANPGDGLNSPFQLGFNTNASFFEHVAASPTLNTQFNNLMSVYHQGRASWMDPTFYPIERLVERFSRNGTEVFLVDVGGGKGHDLVELRQKWPALPGRLILQDQATVLAEATVDISSIEPMVHDFFTEQPVTGARAYFLHSVLHDWPDAVCMKILARLRAAMKPGYSRLLINENVVADTGAHRQVTSLDFVMLGDFAGAERTETQWRGLMEGAGFKIMHIWTADRWSESLIGCEVV